MSHIRYSPVCDTDPIAYQRYLLACVLGSDVDADRLVGGDGRRFESELGRGVGDSVGECGREVPESVVVRSRRLAAGGYSKIVDAFVEDPRRDQGAWRSGRCASRVADPGVGSDGARFVDVGDLDGNGRGNDRQRRADCGGERSESGVQSVECAAVGKHSKRNRARRLRDKALRKKAAAEADSGVDCGSGVSVGSVHTVDTRTGVEIEAAQTLAARRVAENSLAVRKAEADRLLVEHRIRALQDKDRTKAVERLAAVRMEEKINKSKKNSEEAFKQCEASLKSLGSTGSAGEFALKQQIKDARDNEAILKYVQEQNKIYSRNASPEVLDAVSRVKPPVIQEEYDAFGDCPSDYDEDEAEAYNNDRNRRNDEMAQRLQGMDEAPLW